MQRRGFIKGAAALGILGLLKPRLTFGAQAETSDFYADYQINPARLYLKTYVPPQNSYDFLKNQTLFFDNVVWSPDAKQNLKPRNLVSGGLSISRKHVSDELEYLIEQKATDYVLTGVLRCKAGGLRDIVSFEFENVPNASSENSEIAKYARFKYAGSSDGKVLFLNFGALKKEIPLNGRALITQWQLLDGADMWDALAAQKSHSVLWDAFEVLQNRNFFADGQCASDGLGGGVFKTYMSEGGGASAFNFLKRADGLPIGLTCFVNSWVLKSIEG